MADCEITCRRCELQNDEKDKVFEKLVICRDFLRNLCKRGEQCKLKVCTHSFLLSTTFYFIKSHNNLLINNNNIVFYIFFIKIGCIVGRKGMLIL